MFKSGMFQIDANSSPEQVQQKRAMIAALLPRFGSAKYVGEGIGQLATGVMAGRQNRKLDEIEGKGRASANDLFARIFGGASAAQSPDMGPLTVLGMKDQPAPPITPADPSNPEAIASDAMAALGKGDPDQAAHPGQTHSEWLKYSNQSATRNDPLDPSLVSSMSFLGDMGITMDVVSGGQEAAGEGGTRTGSTRHDHGKAADVDFYKDGRKLDWNNPNDMPILTQIVQTAKANGVTGIGAGDDYMGAGRFHVGFGNPGVWGAGGKGANAPSWLVDAYNGAPAGAAPAASGAALAPTSAPTIPINELYMALQNPWLSGEQKGLITSMIAEQQQASDPMRQLELEKAQLELAQMKAPPAPPEEMTTRMMLAKEAGLDPGSPEYQTYLLTGKLPDGADGNVPAGFATLDLQAKAAGYEPGTPEYQEFMRNGGASGTPAAFTALDLQAKAAGYEPGTPEYKRFMASRGAYERSADAAAGKAEGEDAALYASMKSKMPGLENVVAELGQVAEEATYTGAGQAVNWLGKQMGFEPTDAAVARTKYIAMVDNQVLPMLRDTFGAAFTVAEGDSLRATLGDPDKTPEEKQVVLKSFIEQKKRDLEALGSRVGGDAKMPDAVTAGAPANISSDAEYDALPSGTMFVGPDGKTRRKP